MHETQLSRWGAAIRGDAGLNPSRPEEKVSSGQSFENSEVIGWLTYKRRHKILMITSTNVTRSEIWELRVKNFKHDFLAVVDKVDKRGSE